MKVSTPVARVSFQQRFTWLFFSFIVMMLVGPIAVNAQISITTNGVAVTQNFDGMGSSAAAALPTGFKIGTDWSTGTSVTGAAYGTTGTGVVTSSSGGNTVNWANGITASSTDRALGFLNSGSFTSPKSIVLKVTNNTGVTIASFAITFDYEKYRSGTRQFDWTFFHGNTVTPATAAAAGNQTYAPDGNNTTVSNPPTTIGKSVSITGLSIANGSDYYFMWTFTGLGGSTNGQGIGIDNFSITSAPVVAPTVTTTTATSITLNGASSGGNVTADGGASVTARGVAYGISANPTISGSVTSDGTGTGSFTSTISGLSANTQYFYRAYATNPAGTNYGNESSFYTLAFQPGTPLVNVATTTTLTVTPDANGNPGPTEYAIQETGSGNYVQGDGSLGASAVWQTAGTWGARIVTGLSVNTNYTFHVKARNGSNVETAFGLSTSLYTLANTPGIPTVNNPSSSTLDVTLTLNGNPASTEYVIQETGGNYVQADGSLSASPVWQTASVWGTKTVTGLTPATSYSFQAKARNGNLIETAFGSAQSGMTNAANQPDLTETTLNGFGNVCINTTTAAHTFTLNGTDLTIANVTVGPLAGYSFSTDDITYTSSLSIVQGGGSFSQLIYVKFSPTSVQSYDGNIPVGGGGATSDNVAVTGSGINTAPTVTTGAASNVTINSATIPGTITDNGCSSITAYGAEYSINNGFANGTGVQFPGSNLNLGSFTVDISVLNPGTPYYYHTYATNNGGTSYSSQGTFTTLTPSLNTSALTAFGNVCINTTTTAHTFTITGTNLSTADVTVASLNGYSYSTDDITYTASLTISQPGGAFSQLVYVKFSPTLVQSYNGNIVVGGGGAANSNVAASGSGINTAPAITTGSASGVTQTSATLNGTITDNGCSSISAYGIEYSTLNGFANGSGTQVAGGVLSLGAYSSAVSGLNPGVTYYYKAYATNAGGTTYGLQQSFATPGLDAPVATAATDNNTGTSFTANWNPVAGAGSYRLDVSTLPGFGTPVVATDLFFSEYIEGSSNNKYIEIYNGTGASVNLGDYRLRLYANGAATPTSDVLLSGTLTNGSTIVYKNSAATIYAGTATNNAAVNYNGDDAMALFKVSTSSNVDIFGRIGEDPGTNWSGGGNSTLDKTLVRNANVAGGVTVNPGSGFPTLGTEWTQFNVDVVSNLGSHTFTSFNPSFVAGYNNLTVNGTSQSVTGLSSNTTYYYRVRAFSPTSTSANSNVITVVTSCVASVTASAGANGTVTPTGTTNYNCGDNAAYLITPNSCYTIADVVVDGSSVGAVSSYTFTNIAAGSHTISATFTLASFAITASAGPGGTISPDGVSNVNCGSNLQYTITPAACNSVADVLVDGVSVGAVSTYTFTNVTDIHTIEASFIATPYTIVVTQGSNGSISPGSGTVNCGGSQEYTITPDPCYTISDVIVDGVSVGAVPSYEFTNVQEGHTITATFSVITYTITASSGANGTVTPAGASIVNCGSNNAYTITAAACYHVADVLVDGASVGAVTSYTFTNTQANHTISATFALNAALVAPVVTGPVNVCQYIGTGDPVVYTFNSVNATGYNYILPPNTSLVSSTANSITLNFLAGFAAQANKQIRVTALSGCGNSPQTIYYLAAQAPSTPGPITASSTNVCGVLGTAGTITYKINAVQGATNYIWTAPAGTLISHPNGAGVNDTLVTLSFNNAFNTSSVTVQVGDNGCGVSGVRSLLITRNNPSTPGLITGPTNVCANIAPNGVPAVYSVAAVAGSTYTWTVPAGAIGLTGQGTASVSFTYPAGYTGGTISVVASNGCGNSGTRSLSVTKLNPATPSAIDVIETQSCPNRIYTYSVSAMPANAVSVQWTIPVTGILVSGQGSTSIAVSYPGTAIDGFVTATAVNNCGQSTARSVKVKLAVCEDGPPPPPPPFAKGGTATTTSTVSETMQVNVYPNPTINDFKLQVTTTAQEKISVRIADMQGRSLKQFTVLPYQVNSIGSDLQAGSYMIETRQGSQVKTTKLIKF